MNYEIKIFPKLESELKEYWEKLEEAGDCYCFQSYDWFENWLKIYRDSNDKFSLCVITVLSDTKPICILPFEIEKKSNVKILKWAGGDKSDYFSPILSKNLLLNKEEFIYIWNEIIKKIPKTDLIYLNKQPEYIEKKANPFVSFLKNYKDSNVYQISLPEKWDTYTKNILKKNFYIQNKRKKKLLKKEGNLKFKVENDREIKSKLLEEFLIQKNQRLRSQGIKNLFNEKDINFYKEFEKKNLKNIKTHFSSLTLNNELIAIHWGIIYKNRFYYLLLSMKEGNLSRYSPGRLLISLLIRWSISKKIKYFDFALGEEEYKKSWSNKTESLYNFIKLNTFNGLFFYSIMKIKLILKSADEKKYLRRIFYKFKKSY